MSFNPKRRYSAVAVLSEDLDSVVLIHKLRPDWQVGKANLPSEKVGLEDVAAWYRGSQGFNWLTLATDEAAAAHRRCVARELTEKTGLVVDAAALKPFCILRFKSREGDDAECRFYAVRGDVEAARTMEAEEVFCTDVVHVLRGTAHIRRTWHDYWVPTMPNLPYLIAMARQCLRGDDTATWPLTVYEAGAAP